MSLASLGIGALGACTAALLLVGCGPETPTPPALPVATATPTANPAAASDASPQAGTARPISEDGDAAPPVVRVVAIARASIATPAAAPVAPRVAAVAAAGASVGAARVVDRGSPDRRFIALSFDAGSDAGYTSQILDTLRAEGIVASFGITGRWSEQHPALLRRIVAEGHHLINHTYDHGSFTGVSTSSAPLSAEARHRQLDRTAEVVRSIAGVEFGPYFRPPYGDYDASVNADVAARGYTWNVMWTVDSLGWNGLGAAAIVDRCLARAAPGAIYIFHVGSQSQDGPALQPIIQGFRAQGYAMGTVAALLEG